MQALEAYLTQKNYPILINQLLVNPQGFYAEIESEQLVEKYLAKKREDIWAFWDVICPPVEQILLDEPLQTVNGELKVNHDLMAFRIVEYQEEVRHLLSYGMPITHPFFVSYEEKRTHKYAYQNFIEFAAPIALGITEKNPFKYIEEKRYDELEKWLQSAVYVDVGNNQNDGLLHVAARLGDIVALSICVEHGCYINRRNAEGDSAAIVAMKAHQWTLVKWLCEKDGNCLILCNKEGKTVEDYVPNIPAIQVKFNKIKQDYLVQVRRPFWIYIITKLNLELGIPLNKQMQVFKKAGLLKWMSLDDMMQHLQEKDSIVAIEAAALLSTHFPNLERIHNEKQIERSVFAMLLYTFYDMKGLDEQVHLRWIKKLGQVKKPEIHLAFARYMIHRDHEIAIQHFNEAMKMNSPQASLLAVEWMGSEADPTYVKDAEQNGLTAELLESIRFASQQMQTIKSEELF